MNWQDILKLNPVAKTPIARVVGATVVEAGTVRPEEDAKLNKSFDILKEMPFNELVNQVWKGVEDLFERVGGNPEVGRWIDDDDAYVLDQSEENQIQSIHGLPWFDSKLSIHESSTKYIEEEDVTLYEEFDIYYSDWQLGKIRLASYTGTDGFYYDGAKEEATEGDRELLEQILEWLEEEH
mgnify:CR=1 FL=1